MTNPTGDKIQDKIQHELHHNNDEEGQDYMIYGVSMNSSNTQ